MKKLNRKGVTLVELIVSFAIVGVAIIYFFQTLTTVNKLYYTARKETNEFIEKSYVLRIADEYISNYINRHCNDDNTNECNLYKDVINVCNTYNLACKNVKYDILQTLMKNENVEGILVKFDFIDKNGKIVTTLYKYIKQP